MTEPVDLTVVEDLIGELSKSYMVAQAITVDSLGYQTTEDNPWHEVNMMSRVACESIYQAITTLVHLAHRLKMRR